MPNCPKCNIPYSGPKITRCLLCGADLTGTQIAKELPKSGKIKEIEKQLEAMQVDDDKVPSFDDKGGFSKKNSKKDVVIGQLQADKEALERRLSTFENIYKKEHPEGRPWYASFGTWFALLLTLGLFYLIYWFVESQGGLPHEFYEFLRRFKL